MKAGAIMNDVVLVTDTTADAAKMINITLEYSDITGMQINPKKSAYVYRNVSTKHMPKYKNKEFKDLRSTQFYKYLRI